MTVILYFLSWRWEWSLGRRRYSRAQMWLCGRFNHEIGRLQTNAEGDVRWHQCLCGAVWSMADRHTKVAPGSR